MSIAVWIAVLCDEAGCEARYEADSSSETMALYEAREEGWKVHPRTQAARCPEHRGGASLLALGSGAL